MSGQGTSEMFLTMREQGAIAARAKRLAISHARLDAIISYVRTYQGLNSATPSLSQIGHVIGVRDRNRVSRYLSDLESAGRIKRQPSINGKPRSITILKSGAR